MAHTYKGKTFSGSVQLTTKNGTPVWRQEQGYRVEADADEPIYSTILATNGLPVPNVTFTADGLMICQSLGASRTSGHRRWWEVTAEFSSEVEQSQNSEFPEEWVPIYETKFERVTEVATTDASGTAVANSAGQLFPNGITIARFLPVWEFYQFESASVTDQQIIDRNEVVNNAVFKGRAANTLLCTVQSSVIGFFYGRLRRFTQYRLVYNKKNWRDKRLDTGTVYLDAGTLKAYTDADGNVIEGALNGSGAKQTAGTAPAIRNFDQYTAVNFSTFLR